MRNSPFVIKTRQSPYRWLLLSFLLAILSGCGGFTDQEIQQAEHAGKSIKQLKEQIQKQQSKLQNFLSQGEGKSLMRYHQDEHWEQFFSNAYHEQKQAENIFNDTVSPIIDKNDDKQDRDRLHKAFAYINLHLKKGQNLAQKPSQRADFIFKYQSQAPKLLKEAEQHVKNIDGYLKTAKSYTHKPIEDYPVKANEVRSRYKALDDKGVQAHKSYTIAKKELALAKDKINYASFADNIKIVQDNDAFLKQGIVDLKAKFDELYKSYAKILDDMRIDYYVQIGRTSWDNYYDYPTEHTTIFTSKVSEKVAKFFDLYNSTVARFYIHSSSKFHPIVSRPMWDALKINPATSWPSGDDEAEFWVQNILYKYYHKYLVVENGQQKPSQWTEVSESYFWQNQRNLGMTVLSKPYGQFEEDTIKLAAPPGIEYIAKPIMVNGKPTGSNQYGEWKQDNNGQSFWQFVAAYAFLQTLIGPPYRYDQYKHYQGRDHSSHYYGHSGYYGTYGSRTYGNRRYRNSTYAGQNPGYGSKGYAQKQAKQSSIRGAGARSRGRGPSGGGK